MQNSEADILKAIGKAVKTALRDLEFPFGNDDDSVSSVQKLQSMYGISERNVGIPLEEERAKTGPSCALQRKNGEILMVLLQDADRALTEANGVLALMRDKSDSHRSVSLQSSKRSRH